MHRVAQKVETNLLQNITSVELREKQLGDPAMSKVIGWLESGKDRPTWRELSTESEWIKTLWGAWNQLCMKDGVLRKKWEDYTGRTVLFLMVIPKSCNRRSWQVATTVPLEDIWELIRCMKRSSATSIGIRCKRL